MIECQSRLSPRTAHIEGFEQVLPDTMDAPSLTWKVAENGNPATDIVIKGEVPLVWHLDRPVLVLLDVGHSEVCHCQLTADTKGIQDNERGVPQPKERVGNRQAQLLHLSPNTIKTKFATMSHVTLAGQNACGNGSASSIANGDHVTRMKALSRQQDASKDTSVRTTSAAVFQ